MSDDPMSPPVLSLPVVLCPACGHRIDPHGTDPGGICGVGDAERRPCPCLWSPNDIAAKLARSAGDSEPNPFAEWTWRRDKDGYVWIERGDLLLHVGLVVTTLIKALMQDVPERVADQ